MQYLVYICSLKGYGMENLINALENMTLEQIKALYVQVINDVGRGVLSEEDANIIFSAMLQVCDSRDKWHNSNKVTKILNLSDGFIDGCKVYGRELLNIN